MSGDKVREQRMQLRLSQSELSRQAHVSRYKLNVFEAGGSPLAADEIDRINRVLHRETQRLRRSLAEIEEAVARAFGEFQ